MVVNTFLLNLQLLSIKMKLDIIDYILILLQFPLNIQNQRIY